LRQRVSVREVIARHEGHLDRVDLRNRVGEGGSEERVGAGATRKERRTSDEHCGPKGPAEQARSADVEVQVALFDHNRGDADRRAVLVHDGEKDALRVVVGSGVMIQPFGRLQRNVRRVRFAQPRSPYALDARRVPRSGLVREADALPGVGSARCRLHQEGDRQILGQRRPLRAQANANLERVAETRRVA
jgi:hypothetical protein